MLHRPVIALTALLAAGCGHAMSTPMPDVKGTISIRVVNEEMPFPQLPLGTYRIPDTAVYVSGHQDEAYPAETARVFGLLGIWMAHGAAQHIGETKTKDAQTHLSVDLVALAEQSLADELARKDYANRIAPGGEATGGSLEVIPFAVVTFISQGRARLWVGLKVSLVGPDGTRVWKTRYHAGVGDDRRLTGEESWTADDGTLVRDTIRRNLRLVLDALLRDASGQLRRGPSRGYRVSAQWLWFPNLYTRNALVLEETDEVVVVLPDVSDDSQIVGVSILDKKSIFMIRSVSQ
jgi:hypothetical protein